MKTPSPLLLFVIILLQSNFSFACSCSYFTSFCEDVTSSTKVLQVEVISKYTDDYQSYMDIKILESLQETVPEEVLTVVNQGTSCDISHDIFEISDTLLIQFNELIPASGMANHSSISFWDCSTPFLRRMGNQVSGYINENISVIDYEEFKTYIGLCNSLTSTETPNGFLEKSISIFPNPTTDIAKIDLGNLDPSEVSIEIFSTDGQRITSIQNLQQYNYKLSMSDFSKGVYFLKIQYRNELIVKKVVKM
jgi:hypothetical protein